MSYGKKIFVLGVGAQKSGTSWLHSYISNNEKANMGFTKEYHIWDAVCSPLCTNFRVTRKSLLRFNKEKLLRYCMQNIPGFYERYFKYILSHHGISITGDITPSYAILSTKDLKMLKEKIQLTGASIKIVYLMRDPVERCWSAVRMGLRQKRNPENQEEKLRNSYQSEQYQFRTRYEVVCENLKHAFAQDELYFGFYETMFSEEEICRLSSFLDIPPVVDHRRTKVNVSEKTSCLSESLRQEVRNFYSDTYAYCKENFPEVERIWA